MKDHVYHSDDGRKIPVSEMTDQEIQMALEDGINILTHLAPDLAEESVRKRLELELFIRRQGLRK